MQGFFESEFKGKKKDIEKLLASMNDKSADDCLYENLCKMTLLPDDYADKEDEEETSVYIGMDVVGSSGNISWLYEGDFFDDVSKVVPALSSGGYHENVDSNIVFWYNSGANSETVGYATKSRCPYLL